MLPKREELDKLLKINQDRVAKEKEAKRIKDEEAAKCKRKAEDEKFEKDVQDTIKRIEEDILHSIEHGKDSTYRYYGNGHSPEPVWEGAVTRMKLANKDYTFKIESTYVHCDNFSEAANVDYVSAREWDEPYWKLTISW